MIIGFGMIDASAADVDGVLRELGFSLRTVGEDGDETVAVYAAPDGDDLALVVYGPTESASLTLTGHAPERWRAPLTNALGEAVPGPEDDERVFASAFGPRPHRPRLSHHVEARVEQRGDRTSVRLTDARQPQREALDAEQWRILRFADGSRDLAGIRLAAAAAGSDPGPKAVGALIDRLAAAGMLDDGLSSPARAPSVAPPPATPPNRPLEVLAGFRLSCDGRGACCRFYGGVPFTGEEAKRAGDTWPERTGDLGPGLAFTPSRGAHPGRRLAVATVDGACLFLEGDGCGLHRRGGADAKPLPCRSYPATYVDDGVAVRVSVMPECACVFASLGDKRGEPLVRASAARWGDLHDGVVSRRVDAPFALTASRVVDAAEAREITRALSDAFRDTPGDPAAFCFAVAAALESDADPMLPPAGVAPPFADADAQDALGALRTEAEHAVARGHGSSASGDALRWLLVALAEARSTLPVVDARAERFYLRALVFGHRLAAPGQTMARGLRRRAGRLLSARAMAAQRPDTPWPLAHLEAALRHRAA